jgi:hypothetical protein
MPVRYARATNIEPTRPLGILQFNCKEKSMRRALVAMAGAFLLALPVSGESTDEIIAKYIKAIGGSENVQALKTLRRTGKITVGGGFELVILH